MSPDCQGNGASPRFLGGLGKVVDVRDARVRVLRAQRATIPPKDDAYIEYQKLDDRIQSLLDTPAIAILAEYGWTRRDRSP